MFKSRDIANKGPYGQGHVLPSSHVWFWTLKKMEHQRIDAFKLCWRRLLRDPCTAKRSNQSILKEINPEYSLKVHIYISIIHIYFKYICTHTHTYIYIYMKYTYILQENRSRVKNINILVWLIYIYIFIWLICVVGQKPTQHCKIIIFQLKNTNEKDTNKRKNGFKS